VVIEVLGHEAADLAALHGAERGVGRTGAVDGLAGQRLDEVEAALLLFAEIVVALATKDGCVGAPLTHGKRSTMNLSTLPGRGARPAGTVKSPNASSMA